MQQLCTTKENQKYRSPKESEQVEKNDLKSLQLEPEPVAAEVLICEPEIFQHTNCVVDIGKKTKKPFKELSHTNEGKQNLLIIWALPFLQELVRLPTALAPRRGIDRLDHSSLPELGEVGHNG